MSDAACAKKAPDFGRLLPKWACKSERFTFRTSSCLVEIIISPNCLYCNINFKEKIPVFCQPQETGI
jgi:hypothetical protein